MLLQTLNIVNFKNIAEAQFTFSQKLNCLLGDNGMGKSNLLDAIYYLSFCKSFTGAADSLITTRGEQFTLLQAQYQRRDATEDIQISLGPSTRKAIKRSGKEYRRFSAHIGKFPAVLISPSDSDLINGSPAERRRFIDIIISQSDPQYLDHLIRYNHNLEQRNRLLRDNVPDTTLFMAIETAMDISAGYITRARAKTARTLTELHTQFYNAIAATQAPEFTNIQYTSALTAEENLSLADLLERNRPRDHMLRYTSQGPHRDDLTLTLNSMPLSRTASQGQQKTFTIALRLAQYEFLSRATQLKPLLLLDDIFDKLDARRVEAIINVVADNRFGQIFITDTNRKHLDEILGHIPASHSLWSVTDGKYTPMQI